MVETTRWGVLYCPKTGINSKRKRWEKIESVLKERGVVFDMVQSENSDRAICMAFGAEITYASRLMHGKQSDAVLNADCPLFVGCPGKAPVARYHSLAVNPATLPDCLSITARTADGEVMAVQHTEYPIYGVQFHPESIMTPDGKTMLENFIHINNKTKSKSKRSKSK